MLERPNKAARRQIERLFRRVARPSRWSGEFPIDFEDRVVLAQTRMSREVMLAICRAAAQTGHEQLLFVAKTVHGAGGEPPHRVAGVADSPALSDHAWATADEYYLAALDL